MSELKELVEIKKQCYERFGAAKSIRSKTNQNSTIINKNNSGFSNGDLIGCNSKI